MSAVYRYRNTIASVFAIAFLAVAIFLATHPLTKPHKPVSKEPIAITLAPPPPELPPPPPEPPKPQPPQPTPPKPTPAPPKPVPAPPRPTPTPTPSPTQSPPQPAPPPQVQTPPSAPVETPPSPSPPPPKKADGSAAFIAQIKRVVEQNKRYPTGREASIQRPKGTVRVAFTLKRDGSLAGDPEIEADVILLEKQAEKTINSASFPPFPEDAFVGETTHRFTTELVFEPQ